MIQQSSHRRPEERPSLLRSYRHQPVPPSVIPPQLQIPYGARLGSHPLGHNSRRSERHNARAKGRLFLDTSTGEHSLSEELADLAGPPRARLDDGLAAASNILPALDPTSVYGSQLIERQLSHAVRGMNYHRNSVERNLILSRPSAAGLRPFQLLRPDSPGAHGNFGFPVNEAPDGLFRVHLFNRNTDRAVPVLNLMRPRPSKSRCSRSARNQDAPRSRPCTAGNGNEQRQSGRHARARSNTANHPIPESLGRRARRNRTDNGRLRQSSRSW
jgi:hypothetical protein